MTKQITLLFLLITLLTGIILIRNINNVGYEDWDQHYAYAESAIISIIKYHQLPLWNPYHCGGIPKIGNPQSNFLNPLFLIVLISGPVVGYKILFLTYFFIGLYGFYLLGQYLKISKISSIALSATYMFSGITFMPLASGVTNFFPLALLPLLYLSFLKKQVLLSGLILTLIFFGGYHYILNIILFLFIISLTEIYSQKSLQPLKTFIISSLVFLSLSSIKLIPMLEITLSYPRFSNEGFSGYSLSSLANSLFNREQAIENFPSWGVNNLNFFSGINWDIHENGMYVGLASFILFLFGIKKQYKKHKKLLFVFLFFLILSFGLNIFPSPYKILHDLPFFNFMRVAQRYSYFFMIFYVIFVGFGLDYLIKKFKISKKIVILFIIINTIDLFIVNKKIVDASFNSPPLPTIEKTENFKQRCSSHTAQTPYDSFSDEYPYTLANYGTTKNCYENIPFKIAALCETDPAYRGEHYLLNNNGRIKNINWSPNAIEFYLEINQNDTLIVNQNFNSNWKAEINGKKAESLNTNGLLSVNVTPASTHITLYYISKIQLLPKKFGK